jgi:hypothetical protein
MSVAYYIDGTRCNPVYSDQGEDKFYLGANQILQIELVSSQSIDILITKATINFTWYVNGMPEYDSTVEMFIGMPYKIELEVNGIGVESEKLHTHDIEVNYNEFTGTIVILELYKDYLFLEYDIIGITLNIISIEQTQSLFFPYNDESGYGLELNPNFTIEIEDINYIEIILTIGTIEQIIQATEFINNRIDILNEIEYYGLLDNIYFPVEISITCTYFFAYDMYFYNKDWSDYYEIDNSSKNFFFLTPEYTMSVSHFKIPYQFVLSNGNEWFPSLKNTIK